MRRDRKTRKKLKNRTAMLIEDHGFRQDVRAVRPKTRDIRKELFWKRDLTTRLVKENFMDTDKEDVSSLLRELYIRYINEEKEGLVLINTPEGPASTAGTLPGSAGAASAISACWKESWQD